LAEISLQVQRAWSDLGWEVCLEEGQIFRRPVPGSDAQTRQAVPNVVRRIVPR